MRFTFLCKEPLYRVGKRVAVVGAGPAGLTVAGYLACRGYEIDVYDKLPYPGGLMTFAIPRRRIPLDEVVEGWQDLERSLGVRFYLKTKVSAGEGHDEGDDFVERRLDLLELSREYSGVVVATGTWRSRSLGVDGENAKNVVSALAFLYSRRLEELGLSGHRRWNGVGKAVVIGAGLSAVDAAEECLSMGVKEVYLAYRRTINEAPAGRHRIMELVDRGVKWVELVQPKRIVVENGVAKGVEFVNVRLGPPDESGRPSPVPVPGTEHVIDADLVVVAVGEMPTPPIYSGELMRYVDPSGKLIVGPDYRIGTMNIFAAGDVVIGPSRIGLAIDHALKVARAVDQMLSGERVSVADMLKKLNDVGKPSIALASWSSELAKELCEFLSRYADVSADSCRSSAPFARVFDYGRCMGCETCSAVCGFIHDGKSYIKVRKVDEGFVFPTACLHCFNARCVSVCKRDAFVRGELGELLIDYKRCNNCMDCFYTCPLKAIRISRGSIANCDLCLGLRRGGLAPACISMCPSRAIRIVAK